MRYLKTLTLATALVLPTLSSASYIENKIDHFGEIEKYVQKAVDTLKANGIDNPEKKVLVILDWDRTISKHEGKISPLSESRGIEDSGLKSTKDVIAALNENGIRMLVLTARGGGGVHSSKALGQIVKPMKEEAGLTGSSVFTPETAEKFEGADADEGKRMDMTLPGGTHVMITDKIVFAGKGLGTAKAEAVDEIISKGLLKDVPKEIIFVDNSHRHLDGFKERFGPKENVTVTALYYPKFGDEN